MVKKKKKTLRVELLYWVQLWTEMILIQACRVTSIYGLIKPLLEDS
jgi:hypothetical protein